MALAAAALAAWRCVGPTSGERMTDWGTLHHAYGDAGDVPALLDRLTPDPKADAWDEVWSRLCHQGTVYSASFAALPHLLELARAWEPTQRPMILSLAGAIIGSQDVAAATGERAAAVAATASSFEQLALETLARPTLAPSDFIHVAQAILAFRGDPVWGEQLDRLESGEFEGVCPRCDAELLLVVGQYGFFATAEEWVNRPATKRGPIVAAAAQSLRGAERWLYDRAAAAHQELLMQWLLRLFGSTKCPSCKEEINVGQSVERACGPTKR